MKPPIVNSNELRRLIEAFECEAAKFHNLRLTTYIITQTQIGINRVFARPNHNIMLWQYYGMLDNTTEVEKLIQNLQTSDLQMAGVRGAQISNYALLEGEALPLFLRMAERAGALFDAATSTGVSNRILGEVSQAVRQGDALGKPTGMINSDPVAIWLNYLLYHLSLVDSRNRANQRIKPDPFTLSLLALERLEKDQELGKIDQSATPIDDINFDVAFSFPGTQRNIVSRVAQGVRDRLGPDKLFYDHHYQAQLARPNLDLLLQDIYVRRSDLNVIFLSQEYQKSDWCGLEWRAIRSEFLSRHPSTIMFIRFDDSEVAGVYRADGYIDARDQTPAQLADAVAHRIAALKLKTSM